MLRDPRRGSIPMRAAGEGIRTAAWAPVLVAMALAGWPGSTLRAQSSGDQAALERGADPSIRPGDDFFSYANGAWLKATVIPAGKERWNARSEIGEVTRQQIAQLLDDAGAAPAGSLARKVADFRAAYLNEAAIEARGIAPLKPLFDSIDRVRDKASLTRLLGRGLAADVDPLNWGVYQSSRLLGLSVEPSLHGEKTYVAFLLQGGLGLPDREPYVSTEPGMQALRAKYQRYIGRLLALAGFDRAEQRAAAVMTLETALAQSQATKEASAHDQNADSVWTRGDFARRAPGMDWSAFFKEAGLARQESFVVWQPTAATGLAAEVGSAPLEAWKDYLRFHVLDEYAEVLPRAYAEEARALHGAAVTGTPDETPRAQRALAATEAAMSGALGRMYAERYFPAEQKARVQAIGANVIAALRQRVEAVTWMSAGTKRVALAKLQHAVPRHRLPGAVGGLFRPDGGPDGRGGESPAGGGPELPPCAGPAGAAGGHDGVVDARRRRSAPCSCSSRMRSPFRRRCCRRPSMIRRRRTPRITARSAPSSATRRVISSTRWGRSTRPTAE